MVVTKKKLFIDKKQKGGDCESATDGAPAYY